MDNVTQNDYVGDTIDKSNKGNNHGTIRAKDKTTEYRINMGVRIETKESDVAMRVKDRTTEE